MFVSTWHSLLTFTWLILCWHCCRTFPTAFNNLPLVGEKDSFSGFLLQVSTTGSTCILSNEFFLLYQQRSTKKYKDVWQYGHAQNERTQYLNRNEIYSPIFVCMKHPHHFICPVVKVIGLNLCGLFGSKLSIF